VVTKINVKDPLALGNKKKGEEISDDEEESDESDDDEDDEEEQPVEVETAKSKFNLIFVWPVVIVAPVKVISKKEQKRRAQ